MAMRIPVFKMVHDIPKFREHFEQKTIMRCVLPSVFCVFTKWRELSARSQGVSGLQSFHKVKETACYGNTYVNCFRILRFHEVMQT